jgi:group I intron endonuclease
MRHGSIYIATNKHTGDQYVGQTRKPVEKRWDSHWRTAICATSRKAKFQNAIIEFGKDAFEVYEVFVAFDAEALNFAEIAVIADLTPAYNSSRGGKGLRPITVSDATKLKRSEAAKARWANPEWKAKTVQALQAAAQTPEASARGKALRVHKGSEKRWAGHIKKERVVCNQSEKVRKSWEDPTIRQKRIDGLKLAFSTPEAKARRIVASTGRLMSKQAVEKSARAKWKPLYCPELEVTFLCGKYAAEYFGVFHTSVANAVKQKGRLLRKYSLAKVI